MEEGKKKMVYISVKNIGGSYKTSGITNNWRRKELLQTNNCWERMLHNSVKKQKKPTKETNKMLRQNNKKYKVKKERNNKKKKGKWREKKTFAPLEKFVSIIKKLGVACCTNKKRAKLLCKKKHDKQHGS